jgi:hypothetical protein
MGAERSLLNKAGRLNDMNIIIKLKLGLIINTTLLGRLENDIKNTKEKQ